VLKVLHVSKYYYPHKGGIESFVKDLVSSSYYRQNVNADVVYCGKNRSFTERLIGFKVNFNIGKQPVSFGQIRWMLRNMKNYDVIHFHYPNPLLGLVLLSSAKPIVIHWHCDIVVGGLLKIINSPFDYLLRRRARKIIGTSPDYIQFSPFLQKFKAKLSVVPIGIDLNRLRKIGTQDNLPFSHDMIYLLCVGRLTEYKGFSYMLSAMLELPENYVLDIVGDGDKLKELLSLIAKNGLEKRVRILTNVSDSELAAYYERCTVFILPSITRNEAFGIVQLEAFFYGKPVVSTSIEGSGVSWVNKDKETGLVVEPENAKELSRAIRTIVKKESFGVDKRSYVKDNFDIEVVSREIIEIYKLL